jgi:hypothetical protein
VYSRIGDIALKLDIASPSESKGPFTTLVFFVATVEAITRRSMGRNTAIRSVKPLRGAIQL